MLIQYGAHLTPLNRNVSLCNTRQRAENEGRIWDGNDAGMCITCIQKSEEIETVQRLIDTHAHYTLNTRYSARLKEMLVLGLVHEASTAPRYIP